jgi:hypothetical protein
VLLKNNSLPNHHHPLIQIFALFKIQTNFGQNGHFFFLSSPFFFLSPTRPGDHPSRPPFSLPLLFSLSCSKWTQGRGETRGNLCKIAYLPLSHSSLSQPPIDDEQPPRRTPMTPPANHPSPCTSPSLFSRRRRSCTRPCRPELRRQGSRCCLAISTHWTPPTPTNRWLPLRPAVDPAAAPALTVSCTRVDAESVHRVPDRAHVYFARAAHRSAWHRTHTRATPSPSPPVHRRGLLVTKTVHHWTETDLALVDLAHANVSHLHH